MNPLRLSVRFPVTDIDEDRTPAIEAFHRFIQRSRVEGFILDVADYRHVPQGPDVMLIGHDVDYGIDGERFTVVRKRSQDDDAATQLADVLRMGLGAMEQLVVDGALAVAFDRSRFTVAVHDRRLGRPDEVAPQLLAVLEPALRRIHGEDVEVAVVERDDDRLAPMLSVVTDDADGFRAAAALGGTRVPGQSEWDIEVEELERLVAEQADFVLLDVREENEYDIVNLGGRLAPLASLGEHVQDIPADAHVVAHCRSGRRAAKAVGQLREAGYHDAWNVNGGLMAWIDRVDPSLPRY